MRASLLLLPLSLSYMTIISHQTTAVLSIFSHSVSLLTHFEIADDYLDFEIGVHGIYIEFVNPALLQKNGFHVSTLSADIPPTSAPSSRAVYDSISDLPTFVVPKPSSSALIAGGRSKFSATYLPDVMPEQGWSKVEAIDSAIHKSGWKKGITDELRKSIRLTRYRSSKCDASYSEWILARGDTVV